VPRPARPPCRRTARYQPRRTHGAFVAIGCTAARPPLRAGPTRRQAPPPRPAQTRRARHGFALRRKLHRADAKAAGNTRCIGTRRHRLSQMMGAILLRPTPPRLATRHNLYHRSATTMGRSLEQSRSHHYRPQPPQKHFTGANGTINRLRRKVPSLQNGVRHFQAAWEIILRECRGIARADDLAAPAVAAGSNAALPRSAGFAVWRSFSAVAHPASHAACRFSATALPWQLIIGLSSGRDTTAMARSLTARRRRCQTLRGGRYCA